jgi:hypothetical protein
MAYVVGACDHLLVRYTHNHPNVCDPWLVDTLDYKLICKMSQL